MLTYPTAWLLKLRNRHLLALDIATFAVTPAVALALRTDGQVPSIDYFPSLLWFTLASLVIKIAVLTGLGLYSIYWRYASVNELVRIAAAGVVAVFVQTVVFFVLLRPLGIVLADFPRSVPLIEGMLAVLMAASARFCVRLADRPNIRPATNATTQLVLVVGAGHTGVTIVKEMQSNPSQHMQAVGFVDDDPRKLHTRIQGLAVLGDHRAIPALVRQTGASLIIIAMPSASGKTIREVVAICEQTGAQTKIIPGMSELLNGRASISQLRPVQIEDLLRRRPVTTDISAVAELIAGRRVLVTGAGGSIGSELCRQILRFGPAELVLLGHGENSIFAIHNELQQQLAHADSKACQLHAVIGDIRLDDRIRAVFQRYRPEIVFHAAAHKHVPLMEENMVEAITNNVIGTRNLLEWSRAVGVGHFVMISTDKAVNPTSIMGASKRVAELLVHQQAQASGLPYVAVRFGNVLGSRGSVVLTFQQQIANGGPVTVTHPEMVRFFMTIPEAVQLTLQAATIGSGGEVFTLDMGEPIKIVDLARDMITLSGLQVGRDIDIEFRGVRPGEKLYEELFVAGEEYQRTIHQKIFIARNASSFVPLELNQNTAELHYAALQNDERSLTGILSYLTGLNHEAVSRPVPQQPEEVTGSAYLSAREAGA